MSLVDALRACSGFQWDDGNRDKNWEKHGVSSAECEELFFNQPLVVAPTTHHGSGEPRLYILGVTDARRRLFVVCTLRDRLIRVISARDMSRREREEYERS
jgi:uncharacterized protein